MPDWSTEVEAAACEHCNSSFLFAAGEKPERCPYCYAPDLGLLGEQAAGLPHSAPPELILPFTAGAATLERNIQSFVQGIPYPPADLRPEALRNRLKPLYIPMWLVDSRVTAQWQAEVGFNYEVVSHQAQYEQRRNAWQSQQVLETRIRWEPRAGWLDRTYNNISAPALDDTSDLTSRLGQYDLGAARAYHEGTGCPLHIDETSWAAVRLPGRTPGDAWPDTKPSFYAAAANECRQAASADHIREYRWEPIFHDRRWTLMLLPAYTTYYLDDTKNPQPVLLHGQTGQISGVRRASIKRAQRVTWTIAAVAALIFFLGLGIVAASLFEPDVRVVGVMGLTVSLFAGLGSLAPIIIAWQFNRSETGHHPSR